MKDALKSKKEVKEETVEEGIDFKGARREQGRRDKIQLRRTRSPLVRTTVLKESSVLVLFSKESVYLVAVT